MKQFLITVILLVAIVKHQAYCQGMNNIWQHGYSTYATLPWNGTQMNLFNGDTSIVYHERKMPFNFTLANISDSSGNMLFYSNGISVANKMDSIMVNGDSLNPSANTTAWIDDGMPIPQGNIIIPFPNKPNQYLLFHETFVWHKTLPWSVAPELFYSKIDMSLDSGRGALIQKNMFVINDSIIFGEMVACKHANGRDWWLMNHDFNNDVFYKTLITLDTMITYSQHIGPVRTFFSGFCNFSLDGNKFACVNPDQDLDIYDFDRCSGDLSNRIHIPIADSSVWRTLCFSPDNSKLYVISLLYAYQYDLTAANIASTLDTIAVWDGFYSPQQPLAAVFNIPYIGYDGRVYVNCANSTFHLHRIEFPDKLGDSCMFTQHNILCPTYNGFTSPNHPNYHLGPLVGSPCDTLNLTPGPSPKERGVVRVIPNPIKGNILNIEYPVIKNKNNSLKIFDAQGNNVYIRTLPMWSGMHDFPVPNLSPGLYMIQIIDGENRSYGKFCIF
nr:T9SS type A sorting domain-containing protein [Bacteroidota bacterium]